MLFNATNLKILLQENKLFYKKNTPTENFLITVVNS